MSDVQLPLDNASYAIRSYLTANNHRLDPETRALLCGLAACLARASIATRRVTEAAKSEENPPPQPGRWVA